MGDRPEQAGDSSETPAWPEPTDEQTEVLLLGVYHMANPGQDVVNVDADDVLAPTRQRELADLADRLDRWEPDAVAVEHPRADQEGLDEVYGRFQSGAFTYDEEFPFEPDHQLAGQYRIRNETFQIGCRLAEKRGHDRVHAVDSPMDEHVHLDEQRAERIDMGEMTRRALSNLDVSLPDPETEQRAAQEHLDESTIVEHLRWKNREEALHDNHDLMFAGALAGVDDADADLGVAVLSAWYERNIQTVANLWEVVDEDTDRILKIVGSGHVHVLRHLLDETPMFCPASPLPVLADGKE